MSYLALKRKEILIYVTTWINLPKQCYVSLEVRCCFSCSVILKKLSPSSMIFFSFFSKLHSYSHLRNACMYWQVWCFKKCLGHCATFLNSFCYLSQLLFKETCMYCMKIFENIVTFFALSLNKLQNNWGKIILSETRQSPKDKYCTIPLM